MAVLGEDGQGYELALKLENNGVWRTWLGGTLYSTFIHFLSSPSSWQAFMASNDSSSISRAHIHLQLRVRALLFDKASFSLFLPSSSPHLSLSTSLISHLNPSYLQLNGDDVYFTLEDNVPNRDSKVQSQRFRHEEFPDNWYHQFMENYRASRPYLLSFPKQDSEKRNPSEMSNYLKLLESHKRRRVEFKEENGGFGNSNSDKGMQANLAMDDDTSASDSTYFFPEAMFMMNCVPDSAVAPRLSSDDKQKVEFCGVLDTLPQVATKSSIMLERLGIRPEYLEQGAGQSRTKVSLDGNKRHLGQEQAMQMSKKVVGSVLTKVGFEGSSEIPVRVLSQFLSCHISKLGHILKVLADNYKKQFSAIELLKMFLQVTGNSNLVSLAEYVKDTRSIVQQTPQQIQSIQSQPPLQHQNSLPHPQQIPRQMNPQMTQMVHPQNNALQQQQQMERMQRRQVLSPCPVMSMEKDSSLVQVKLEHPPDLPLDNNAYNAINSRQTQPMQWRAQQLQRLIGSAANQMRQPSSMQIPQMQSPNIAAARAPPVKVEGFSELMGGGDSSFKQNPDENKLTSPSK